MYCPVCLSETLKITSSGVINLAINGKQMDTGRYLFSIPEQVKGELRTNLRKKVEEFFRWLGGFQNKAPITEFLLFTSNVACTKGCKVPMGSKFTVVGIIYTEKEVAELIEEMGKKHNIQIDLG